MKPLIAILVATTLVVTLALVPKQEPVHSEQLDQLPGPDFDRAFLHMMIMHHHMAVVMSQPVVERAAHDELQDLAGRIIEAQSAEIAQMQGWLREWYGHEMSMPGMTDQVPDRARSMLMGGPMQPGTHVMPGPHPMAGLGTGMQQMPMMDADMMGLSNLSGPRLEAVYMALMVPHHEAAITMAQQALERAEHEEIKQLARAIITSQSEEIQHLNHWLMDWYRL